METKFGGKWDNLHHSVASDSKATGKRSVEWDLKDWTWDGHLFTAVKNGASNGSSSGSDEVLLRDERELDKRRKYLEVNEEVNEEAGSLNLKLGEQVFPHMEREVVDKGEERTGQKTKVSGTPSSTAVCQVDDCENDLTNAKDYHRRHKVCDVHSKATRALVGNAVQRFCQQCSRFHVLEEFDEEKRSCRRRLAGHNKRRRKTNLENAVSSTSLNDEQGSNYLLTSLLKILSNIHASSSDQAKDEDLLSNLIRNLESLVGSTNERNPAAVLLPVSKDLQNEGTSAGAAVKESTSLAVPGVTIPSSMFTQKSRLTDNGQGGATHNASAPQQFPLLFPKEASNLNKQNASDTTVGRVKLHNFDLNKVYDASQEDLQDNHAPEKVGNASALVPLGLCKDSQQFSRAHNIKNLGSSPSQSPSSSSGEIRTERIDFKLFGKDPSDFPLVLRKQILDWLSSRPTDIESHIRPGCVILTIYICMDMNAWEELHCNLNCSLKRLLESSTDSFWRTGWIYTRVQNHATFVYDGQVVLETPLPLNHQHCRISSITPVAVSLSKPAHFVVKGFNLSQSTSRLLCTLEGEFLVEEICADLTKEADSVIEDEETHQSLSFSCDMPNIVGRGFIEVEDHDLSSSSSFFPFIVAEEDVCSEICTLEKIVEDGEAKNQTSEFLHEMGWLLHKNRLMYRLRGTSADDVDLFPLKRFRWLIEFALDHEWCAVVKKLLSIMFDGSVDAGQHTSIVVALMDIGLLHQAVGKKKSRSVVKFLLEHKEKKHIDGGGYLFRPDSVGPGGLTPLHVAASLDSCEDVLDALTEDPLSVGIEVWKNARDSTGLTPHDYACLRGRYSYIDIVERKVRRKSGGRKEEYVVDIGNLEKKKVKVGYYMETEKLEYYCRQCCEKQKLASSSLSTASLRLYRPAMLYMVGIAAVCVCAALLFKSSPEVMCSLHPFSWEQLKFGSQ